MMSARRGHLRSLNNFIYFINSFVSFPRRAALSQINLNNSLHSGMGFISFIFKFDFRSFMVVANN